MHITINIDGGTTPRQLERIQAAIAALQGPAATAANHQKLFGGEVTAPDRFFGEQPDGSIRRKNMPDLPAPEPVFGQQPVPDVPLADAPSGAAAEASASAPEATQATVPTPPSAAPSAPTPPAAAATQGPAETVDSAGLPWDERIHAGSRATIADGTWRKKRGVDPAIVTQVEAELRAEYPAITAGPTVSVPSVPSVETPNLVSVQGVPALPTPPAAGEGLQFKQITSRVTVALANKTLTGPDLIAKLKELGVENLAALDARPDLWQAALDKLGV